MDLMPNVKEFIEKYIDMIEDEDLYSVYEMSLYYLSNDEFKQLYDIFSKLDFEYDIDEPIDDLIRHCCDDIIARNNRNYICIEAEWSKYYKNYLGRYDDVLDQFEEFEPKYSDGEYWCTVYT